MSKRKRSTIAKVEAVPSPGETPILPPGAPIPPSLSKRKSASRSTKQTNGVKVESPGVNGSPVQSGSRPRRAATSGTKNYQTSDGVGSESGSSLSELSESKSSEEEEEQEVKTKVTPTKKPRAKAAKTTPKTNVASAKKAAPKAKSKKATAVKDEGMVDDPEADAEEGENDVEEIHAAATRPPAVNSAYLPLPWKGRLGYACLCTYLRYCNPPVFSSRTCRMAYIIEHRHPLKDPDAPHHAIKNRPDRDQPADIARGQAYVEALGLVNARDIVKMLRWNDKYGIKFLRLSSEMFPFASHEDLGYKLAPFAAETLAEAGRVAAELGHRLTTHPGQFTQLGSPRKEVIRAAIRDLEYHSELLSLLKLPPQQDRDAVMILHMGGAYGEKEAALDRFRENYKTLSPNIKQRLVLENDDVTWSVHELLPICKELNIPLVLDYHHNNIIHSDEIREGTHDIISLYDEIRATWTRKGITQKMHYSEPTPPAITGRERRKHNPRVATLPPCRDDMDLMIEAKDKEQAVFELMRTYRLPGWDHINPLIPHVRIDENKPEKKKPAPKKKKATTPKKRKAANDEIKVEEQDGDAEMEEDAVEAAAEEIEAEQDPPKPIPEEELGMGGAEGRVYWPLGMEEWLRPPKRVVKKKEEKDKKGKKEDEEE